MRTFSSPSPLVRTVALIGVTATASLIAAAPSSAATTKTSGTTTVKLSAAARSTLGAAEVTLAGIAPARRGATAVKLPITSATLDAATGSGTLNHSGALRFRHGRRTVVLRALRVDVQASDASVSATIGGRRVTVFSVDVRNAKVTQAKKRVTIANLKLSFSATGASRLNRALKVSRFRTALSLGTATATIATTGTGTGSGTATPAGALKLLSGTASLTLTPQAREGLTAIGASLTAVAPATGSGGGPFAFPVSGGTLDASHGFAGSTALAGALRVTLGSQTATLTEPIVNLGPSPSITAIYGGTRQTIFALDLSSLRSVGYDGRLVLDGVLVRQAAEGPLAGGSNQIFGTLRLDATTA